MEGCIICSLTELYIEYNKPENSLKCLIPSGMYFRLKEISKDFEFGKQEDSMEYLLKLLEAIERVHSKQNEQATITVPKSVYELFKFTTKYSFKCNQCKWEESNETEQTSYNLMLPIEDKNIRSVSDALSTYIDWQINEDDKFFKCSQCNNGNTQNSPNVPIPATAYRKIIFQTYPSILLISLNRYITKITQDRKVITSKITRNINYDKELNVADCENGQQLKYKLVGYIIHEGASTTVGHYKTYAFAGRSDSFFEFDDSKVNKLDDFGIRDDAYIFIYQLNNSGISQ